MKLNPDRYSSLILLPYILDGNLLNLLTHELFKLLPPQEQGELVIKALDKEPHIPSHTKSTIVNELLKSMIDLKDMQRGFAPYSAQTVDTLNESIRASLKSYLLFYLILLNCLDNIPDE